VVAHRESVLPGNSLDILQASRDYDENLPTLDQSSHIHIPKNSQVIEWVMQYLTNLAGERHRNQQLS
jgi:hypothetical protein